MRVNAVAPGPIDTGMLTRLAGTEERKAGLVSTVPLKRLGKPDEIAQMIVFLTSDKAPSALASRLQPTAAKRRSKLFEYQSMQSVEKRRQGGT